MRRWLVLFGCALTLTGLAFLTDRPASAERAPADPAPVDSAAAEPFSQTLVSAQRNLNVRTWEATSRQVTPACPAAWSVRKFSLHGGKQEGVDVIVLDNGKLQLTIVPTRGMGVLSVTSGDVRLGWDSPVKEVVNPALINLQSRGGLGWLEGFNEWMPRCGLEFAGHPGTDKFVNNVGEESTMELTLHGRIENLPAQEVEVAVDRAAPYRIRVRGRVDERMFYGPKLELQTEISTEPGSETFRVEDVVTNRGAAEQEFELIYHTSYGRPLLEEGSTFAAAVERITPFNANAAKGIDSYAQYAGPKLGFIEQVYCIEPLADGEGMTLAVLRNKRRDRGVSIAWSKKQLPYFTLWKNTAAEADGYVTGLEPGTNYPYNRRIERQAGRVQKLAAGASHPVRLDFTILSGEEAVRREAEKVNAIQGSRKPVVEREPAKGE
jgi:hypothetical protein